MTLSGIPRVAYVRLADFAFDSSVSSLSTSGSAWADWLGEAEHCELARLRDVERRRQWLVGRWLAKQLLVRQWAAAASSAPRLCPFEILTRDERGHGVRPRLRFDGAPLGWSLSISHSSRGVMVALLADDRHVVGVDLVELQAAEQLEAPGCRRLWFSAAENRWVDEARSAAVARERRATLWTLKEAAYKACQQEESWSPSAVEISPLTDGVVGQFRVNYGRLSVRGATSRVYLLDGHVAAMVTAPRVGAWSVPAAVNTVLVEVALPCEVSGAA